MEEEALSLAPVLANLLSDAPGVPDQAAPPAQPESVNLLGPALTPGSTQLPIYNCTCEGGPGYRLCCDASGCKAYPMRMRNPFWPEFAHPSWLSCQDLYNRTT